LNTSFEALSIDAAATSLISDSVGRALAGQHHSQQDQDPAYISHGTKYASKVARYWHSVMSVSPPGSSATSLSKPKFRLRRANFSDLSGAARTCSLAFGNDPLFGGLIHPRAKTYPGDVDKYWYRRFVVDFWDWSHVFLIATEPATPPETGETVTGIAHWSRNVPKPKDNHCAGWGLAWWDPSTWL
jgi:hypothetical protein